MVYKYEEWISEKAIIDLILESKVVYSKSFINLLNRMKSNKIANELINLYSKDVNTVQNYIDITDNKEEVSFIPDRKAQEFTKDKQNTWKVTESGRYLTNSTSNDRIFNALGYDKQKYGCWSPDRDTIGIILSETVSRVSGKVYVMFQEYNVSDPRIGVINKEAVEPTDADDPRVWTTGRNPIRIGRFVRALLGSAKVSFTDKEIEDFTNQWKATYDFAKDTLKQFDVVTGREIANWYDSDKYVGGGGSLNSSCMAEVDSSYFDIYTSNKNVSLVILYSDDGNISGERYTSNKIKGRALLWNAKLNGEDVKFMDRIYTRFDSDEELFKQYAKKNGWWWKKNQNMDTDTPLTNGTETKVDPSIKVQLEWSDFNEYPYLDTMSYLNENDDCLYNYSKGQGKYLKDTGGGWDDYSD